MPRPTNCIDCNVPIQQPVKGKRKRCVECGHKFSKEYQKSIESKECYMSGFKAWLDGRTPSKQIRKQFKAGMAAAAKKHNHEKVVVMHEDDVLVCCEVSQ